MAVDTIFNNNPNFPINKPKLKELFSFATAQTHFLFNGSFYDQIDGVAMGSPLAPVLANLFMGSHEKIWLENYTGPNVLFYRRYVDDIFCLFNNEHEAMSFFHYLNTQHPNITFTFEKQDNGKLSFLDVLLDISNNPCITSVFHKKTYTGLLTNYFSFTPFTYKIGLIRTLTNRIFKINNTKDGFSKDINQLAYTLKRNSFPAHIINKITKPYLDSFDQLKNSIIQSTENSPEIDTRYFKLPYIGIFSKVAETKIKSLAKRFCTEINIKLVFSSYKIKNLFSFKDPIPTALKSSVIYKFTCAGCKTRYIGETSRHLTTRIKEHTTTDKNSHIFQHLKNPNCKNKFSSDCFKIIDSAKSSFSLKIKEAFHIKRENPELNIQVQHFKTSLTI